MNASVAVCTIALTPTSPTGEMHLFPAGQFRANDGRPADLSAWQMDAEIAKHLITRFEQRGRPLVVDYEHQTLATSQNGQPAPAAGWIDRLIWQADRGLVGLTRWTAQARDWISSDPPAYAYASPVFTYDTSTGVVIDLLHAALTNNPALDELSGVVARASAHFSIVPISHEVAMSLDPEILSLLSLPETAEADDLREAVASLRQQLTDALLTITTLQQQLASQPPMDAVSELRQQVAGLTLQLQQRDRQDLITAAISDGRLLGDTMIAWARADSTPLEALRAYLQAAQPIAALQRQQTASLTMPAPTDPKTDFARDPALQAEFGDVETYLAYQQAAAAKRVTVLGSKVQ